MNSRAKEQEDDPSISTEIEWTGNETGSLVRLAWPIAVSMVSYAVMTTTDTLFVGHLGASELAGVGLAGVTAFTLIAFGFGMLRAVKVLISQARGAGKSEASSGPVLAAGLVFAIVMGAVAVGVGQLLAQAMPRIADSALAGESAADYLSIRVLGAPLVLAYVAFREACYGLGDTKAPMRASIAANLINVGLDAFLIIGLEWGVVGAAVASVIATLVEVGFIAVVGPRLSRVDFRRSVAWMGRLIRIGAPTGLQFLIELGSFATLTFMISAFADVEMAAHQIALQVIHFGFLPTVALGEAASIMAGEAVGANRDRLVVVVARKAMWISGGYMAFCTLALAAFAPLIASAFTSDATVVARAALLLYIATAFQITDAANIVARCVLRGTGDVRFPAVVGVLLAWTVIPPTCYVLGMRMGMGAVGGWIALTAEIFIGAVIFWSRLLGGGWHPAAARSRADVTRSPVG